MFCAVFALTLILSSYSISQDHQDLVVQAINGDEISLKALTEKGPVLLNFWALWCEPCKAEMGQFQSLYDRYREKGFSILTVNEDNQKSVSKVPAYISAQEYTFFVSVDPDGDVAQMFNVQSYPTSLLFDRRGTIVYRELGYKPGDEEKLEEAMKKLFSKDDEQR